LACEGADFGGEFFDDGFGDGVTVDALHNYLGLRLEG
jgi:hypothetical protein